MSTDIDTLSGRDLEAKATVANSATVHRFEQPGGLASVATGAVQIGAGGFGKADQASWPTSTEADRRHPICAGPARWMCTVGYGCLGVCEGEER